MKKILWFLPGCLVAVITICLLKTLRFASQQLVGAPVEAVRIDTDDIVQRFSQTLRLQTISSQEQEPNRDALLRLHHYLKQALPRLHATLTQEIIGDYSLLYTWTGRNDRLQPVLFMAHQDVVPVESPQNWEHPPFAGEIAAGYLWGRGAMDDKANILGLLEAVELLVRQDWQPQRTMYFAFGHDEEIGGSHGAARIAALLRERQVRLDYVLDEGMIIADGILPVPKPVALIGIAEKGAVSLELRVEAEGGHSSMPPPHTAIGVLSRAIAALENHPLPGGLQGTVAQMFDFLGPEMHFGKKLVFANLWLFRPLVEHQLAAQPNTNALMRTTTAVTIIAGGVKDNVLPSTARAVVNFRILPGDSIDSVMAHVRKVINDAGVHVHRYGLGWEPSALSSTTHPSFMMLQRTIHQVFPEVVVAPALVLAGTDSRHYASLTDNIYRFRPHRFRQEDIKRYHGINERISVENHVRGVQFYYQLLQNSAS